MKNNIKVDLVSFGRFHLFNLANEFYKHNVLSRMIISHPRSKWGILRVSVDKIRTNNLEYLRRAIHLMGDFKNNFLFSIDRLNTLFDKNASQKLSKESNCVIALSDSALFTLREAKRKDKLTILERGSSHILFAQKILEEEFSKQGKVFTSFTKQHLERSLAEYDEADYIAIPSSFVKRTFIEQGVPESKLIVNPYGVDLSEFKQIDKEDNIFRIIYAGGGTLRKGYHYLLQAFYELDLHDAELWHLGSISDEVKPYLEKYRHNNWILKGHQPQKELYKYYSQGNMFIMPSIEEGFAMVQFQAMACGLPLICTTNTGGEDLISKNGEEGFVIPIRDVEAIKEKILYLYHNPDIAKKMGEKAKKKVVSGFTWNDYGDRYVNNLEQILKNHE